MKQFDEILHKASIWRGENKSVALATVVSTWGSSPRPVGSQMAISEDLDILGWNFYMPPEQAARGIQLFNELPDSNEDTGGSWFYKDISIYTAWKGYVDND